MNYCRDSDFEAVIKAGVNVTGKIALCKYGKGSRTMKVLTDVCWQGFDIVYISIFFVVTVLSN